jgi:hypothetical protein
MRKDLADSPVISSILMIAILLILFILLLLAFLSLFGGLNGSGALAPPLIKVTDVYHNTTGGTYNFASRVVIENTCTTEYSNQDLMAVFFCNDEELYAVINTLHGEDFIPSHHFGVSTIGGSGCRGQYFSSGEKILVDLKNGYYEPGSLVELRIYQRSTDTRVAPITGSLLDTRYMTGWLQENVYSTKKGYRLISQHKYTA